MTVIVVLLVNFNFPFSSIDRLSVQNLNRETLGLSWMIPISLTIQDGFDGFSPAFSSFTTLSLLSYLFSSNFTFLNLFATLSYRRSE